MLGLDPDPRLPERPRVSARDMAVPDQWGIGAFEMLWRNVLKKAPADRYAKGITDATGRSRDRWRELVERIEIDAGLLEPPQRPAAYAEALMRALPAYIAHAAQHGETVPSISVAAFEGWQFKLEFRDRSEEV